MPQTDNNNAKDNSRVPGLNNLGLEFYQKGEFDKAEACYQAALEDDPDEALVWNNLGVLRFNEERYAEAKTCFEKALSLKPGFEEAQINLRDTLE
ncbi:MAG: tetratricopeptide repeat protein [Spirochaetaceae bacterium]|jgi:tetratricopeptide (TPR) repeat protein|nr:tetratricopeptide repeat protein [Spirochaetaceae bacterium]